MTDWIADELDRVGGADELQVSSRRADGTLRPFITIWTARFGDGIYLRSAYGPDNGWFRRAVASGTGRIRAGGVERDVRFDLLDPTDPAHEGIDRAYHSKYDSYGPRYVATVVGPATRGATLRVTPADSATV